MKRVRAALLAVVAAVGAASCNQQRPTYSPSEPGGVTAIVKVTAPLPASCQRDAEIVVRLNGAQVTVLPAGAKDLAFQFVAVIGVDYTMELSLRSGAVLFSGPLDVKLVSEGVLHTGPIVFECRA